MKLAQERDEEACIGVKIGSDTNDPEKNFGIKLIPPKGMSFEIQPGDALVVVAEDER